MTPPRREHPPDLSDSDRMALDEFLRERDHEKWLAARRKTFRDSLKNGAQLITAIALVVALGKDLGVFLWTQALKLMNGGP